MTHDLEEIHGHRMSAEWFNGLVHEAARNQRLCEFVRDGNSTFLHKWKVSVALLDGPAAQNTTDYGINPLDGKPFFSASVFQHAKPGTTAQPLYQVNVMPGNVNDQPATIEYLTRNDPRGWTMPDNYAPYKYLQGLYGKSYPFVDRPMWEDPAPTLLLTAPSADGTNLGGFIKTADVHRPQFFRTTDAWERDLYQASVMVTLTPFMSDPAATNLAVHGARTIRWRVQAGQLPTNFASGVSGVATQEIAAIYLLRTPGKPEQDEVYVQQKVFWDLSAASMIDLPLLSLLGVSLEVAAAFDIGLIAIAVASGGGGLALAGLLTGAQAGVIGLMLDNVQTIVEDTSGIDFWN